MNLSLQQRLEDLNPEMRSRMLKHLELRFGESDLQKISLQNTDFMNREIDAYLWIEGEEILDARE